MTKIDAVILCGGKSIRFGSDKTWFVHQDKTLIQHAIDALVPQVDEVFLGCRQDKAESLEKLGHKIVCDTKEKEYEGPLGALLSSMLAVKDTAQWLVSAPVDAFGIPDDMVKQLYSAVESNNLSVAIAENDGQLQYTIGIWKISDILPLAESTLAMGNRSMRALLDQTGFTSVAFSGISNINYLEDL